MSYTPYLLRVAPAALLAGAFLVAAHAQEHPSMEADAWARLSQSEGSECGELLVSLLETVEQRSAELTNDAGGKPQQWDALASQCGVLLATPGPWPIPNDEVLERIAQCLRSIEVHLEPGDVRLAQYNLANFALVHRLFEEAGGILARGLERWPDAPELHLLRIDLLRSQDDWLAALAEVDVTTKLLEAPSADPNWPQDCQQVKLAKAALHERLGRADRALLEIRELLDDAHTLPQIRSAAIDWLADAYLSCDRPERVLDLEPQLGAPAEAEHRANFHVKVALARAALALVGEAPAEDALQQLRVVSGRAGVSEAERLAATLRAAQLAMHLGDTNLAEHSLRAASEQIGQASPNPRGALRAQAFHDGLRLRLIRATGESGDQLRRAEDAVLADFEALLQNWRDMPVMKGGVGPLRMISYRRNVFDSVDVALGRDGAEAAFAVLVRAQAMGSLARARGIEPPSLAEIRAALLAHGEVLLVYLPADFGSHLFVVTEHAVERHPLVSQWQLAKHLTALGQAIQDGAADAVLRERARAAAEVLLPAAVRSELRRSPHLRIVGADLLGSLRPARSDGLNCPDLQTAAAFEILPLDGDRPVGFDHAVTYLPSVPVGVWLRNRWSSAARTESRIVACIALGDPRDGQGKAGFTLDQAALSAPFGANSVVIDLSTQPSRAPRELIPTSEMLTFIGHGIIDRTRELFAGLIVRRDEPLSALWADDIQSLGPTLAPLVVFAACGSAEGPVRIGEDGASHLGGAAFAAGACSVAVGSGELPADLTIRLVGEFHCELARGCTPTVALRNARRAVCVAQPFAEFIACARLRLYGLGDAPVLPITVDAWPSGLGIVATVLLGLVLLGFFLRQRARARLSSRRSSGYAG